MTKLENIRPWPCAAECDAPGCVAPVLYVLNFSGAETPGLNTLYLCPEHAQETKDKYARSAA